MALTKKAYKLKITGIVQGVGFRPFVYGLAKSLSLFGKVWNEGADVDILIEGESSSIERFISRIEVEAPPLSKINSLDYVETEVHGYSDFSIDESIKGERKNIYISSDTGTCKDCTNEMLDSSNHRYLYPFINCTNCGPRFTIIKGVPYDRPLTTMSEFNMCDDCKKEYTDPLNRRYHAQPICCPKCGPKVVLTDNKGNEINDESDPNFPVKKAISLLKDGKILAIKGLGGFHLVCDATNENAVTTLRMRKHRDDKPFALMIRDVETVKNYCIVSEEEKKLLLSEKRPIVLLKKRLDSYKVEVNISKGVAAGNPNLGVMIPYTPLHQLLFENIDGELNPLSVLVATSGNISSEPIAYKNQKALEELSDIADYFLINNRDIYIRTDDSVTRIFNNKEFVIRRARGYVPTPVSIESVDGPQILACGGELKSTFCLNKENDFYISHHIGDLENAETLKSFEDGIEHFKRLFEINPEVIAYDLHPEYLSTKYAKELNIKEKVAIQHHHAHIASCMGENGVKGEVIGVAFDGTGYGLDGRIWGGEFFVGSYEKFHRVAYFDYVKLIGGERAVKEPWRMAVSYLKSVGRMDNEYFFDRIERFGVSKNEMEVALKMYEKGFNSPLTSSAGRLFDAASALCGVRNKINYEGQAAIEFEQKADLRFNKVFGYEIYKKEQESREQLEKFKARSSIKDEDFCYIIKLQEMFLEIANLIDEGTTIGEISGRFHHTIANIILDTCIKIRDEAGITQVVLSGGVFQNITLLSLSSILLENNNFKVYTHSRVPTNDGGISLGQALIAAFGGGYYV